MYIKKYDLEIGDNSIKEKIKCIIRPVYYWMKVRYRRLLVALFSAQVKDYKKIPIIINNYNRLEMLLKLINSLEKRGYQNIIIIDNNSTYPPLIDYYNNTQYRVIRLSENVGYLSLWKTDIYKEFISQYYVYTDSDVEIIDECPSDFLKYFYEILKRYPYTGKVGFSLKIDDLPRSFAQRDDVIRWEQRFWQNRIEDNLYLAPIDTTFALYSPFCKWGGNFFDQHIRVGYPYQVRHLPWYIDSNNLSPEDTFYISQIRTKTHWSSKV